MVPAKHRDLGCGNILNRVCGVLPALDGMRIRPLGSSSQHFLLPEITRINFINDGSH